jgi:hypothetical protein
VFATGARKVASYCLISPPTTFDRNPATLFPDKNVTIDMTQ